MSNVNQGSRVQVSLPDFEGLGGFVERSDGSAQLSYRSTKPRGPAVGTLVTIDDVAWQVVSSARSDFVRDFRVLTLKRVEA